MTWFKVDDSFYDHPKFMDIPNSAIGLWVKAGAWCGRHLTDGVIPATQVKRFKGTGSQVDALIVARIWVEERNESGAKVYRFHDWNEYQPSREGKLKEREDAAERQRRSRERKRREQQQRENVTRDSQVTGSRDSRVTGSDVSQRPDPTRPDPTRPDHINKKDVASQSTTSTARDDDWLAAEFPNLADDVAAAARRADTTGIDRDAIRTGIREYASRPQPKTPGLLRTIINDAAEKAAEDTRRREQARARRTVINNCTLCDEHGIARVPGGRTRCPHDQEQLAQLHAQAQADVDARAQAEQERAEKANSPETVQGRWRRKREATTHILDPDTPLPPRTHIIDAEPAQKHTETGHTATNTPPPGTHPTKWHQTPQNPQNKDTT